MPGSSGEAPPKVLVIGQGDAEAHAATKALLQKAGYEVVLQSDPEQALTDVVRDPPEVILCDFELNPVEGLEVCKRFKAGPLTRLVPVVLVTTPDKLDRKCDALDAGAEDLIARPLDESEFKARMRSLVRMRKLTQALENAENVVFALATAIEQKDDYTEGHGERVAQYARLLANHVGLSEREVKAVYTGGILHDVGKIGCPDSILNKPGPLTPEEFQVIKRHPVHGFEICRHLKSLGPLTLSCIRNHHERLDGTGYPDGMTDGSIAKVVRIMSISDVFDALATARAYKPAFPTATCFRILREEAQRGWWDGELVEAFVDMIKEKGLDTPNNRSKFEPILVKPGDSTPS
jgi:putative two-component system response regulator